MASDAGELPLMPGAFVDVEIDGRPLAGGIEVPRRAVYDGDTVWTVDGEDRLRDKKVVVGFGDAQHVVITDGLSPGDRVVTSPLAAPLAGSQVRVIDAGSGA